MLVGLTIVILKRTIFMDIPFFHKDTFRIAKALLLLIIVGLFIVWLGSSGNTELEEDECEPSVNPRQIGMTSEEDIQVWRFNWAVCLMEKKFEKLEKRARNN